MLRHKVSKNNHKKSIVCMKSIKQMKGDFLRWLMDKMKSFMWMCVCVQQNVLLHLTEHRRGSNNGVSDIRKKNVKRYTHKKERRMMLSNNFDLNEPWLASVIYINGLSCVWLANEPWFEHSWILYFDNLFFSLFSYPLSLCLCLHL